VSEWQQPHLNGATKEEQQQGLWKPFTIRMGLALLSAAATAWATPRGGKVRVLENMSHLWQHIYEVGDQPSVLLAWEGETSRGAADRDKMHRTDRRFHAVIMRGHGFKAMEPQPDDGLNPNAASGLSFFTDDIESLRDAIRTLKGLTEPTEFPVVYEGAYPLPNLAREGMANVFLDGADLRFVPANDIPAVFWSAADLPEGYNVAG